MYPPRLSSCCRCGPNNTAIHEMGLCPQMLKELAVQRGQVQLEVKAVPAPIVTTPMKYKPPWVK